MKDKAKKLAKEAERLLNKKLYDKAEAKFQEAFNPYPDLSVRMIPAYGIRARDLFFNRVRVNHELPLARIQNNTGYSR